MRGGELERRAVLGVGPMLDYYRARGVAGTNLDVMGKVLETRVGVQPQSLSVYARDLAVIFQDLGRPVDAATSADVRRAVQALIKRGSARKRISLLRAALEAAGREEFVVLTRKVRIKETRKLQDPDILVIDDVSALLRDAPTRRDKCIVATMWESGRRVHEVLEMNVGDVVLVLANGDTYYRAVFRKSKTAGQEGSCLLIEAAAYVAAWLERHPLRKDPRAPLFVDVFRNRMVRYSYSGVYAMFKRVNAIARIPKPVRPHALRHARITHLLRAGLSDSQVKKAVGLSAASQELARYGHLVQADVDNAILAAHGKAPLEAPKVGGLATPGDLDLVPAMPEQIGVGLEATWSSLSREDQTELVAKAIAQEMLRRPRPSWETDDEYKTAYEDVKRLREELRRELHEIHEARTQTN